MLCKVTLGVLKGASKLNVLLLYYYYNRPEDLMSENMQILWHKKHVIYHQLVFNIHLK